MRLNRLLLFLILLILPAACNKKPAEPSSQPITVSESTAVPTAIPSAIPTTAPAPLPTAEPTAVPLAEQCVEPIYLAIVWHQHQPVYYQDP